jgi:NAD(P)-dependent dehydrogenase (short-subunit alcohol dehydrogenase family)
MHMADVLVTGAAKGLGRATVHELVRRGHRVIAAARSLKALDDLAGNAAIQRLALDVTDDASVRRAQRAVGHVDALINNALETFAAPIETSPLDEVRRLYDINVFGALRMIQAFAPAMRARGAGMIVNVSASIGRATASPTGVYTSTKRALEGLSEALHMELERCGVRVVLIELGRSQPMLDAAAAAGSIVQPTLRPREQPRALHERVTAPELIARTIADAMESPQPKFRWVAGEDAQSAGADRLPV